MKRTLILLLAGVISTGVLSAPFKQGEGIMQDPITSDYIATYWDEDDTGGEFVTATLGNATLIQPAVKSTIRLKATWEVDYLYRVSNGKDAKQGIVDFNLFGLPYETRVSNSVTYGNGNPIYQVDLFGSALLTPNAEWYGSGKRAPRSQKTNLGWHFNLSDLPLDKSRVDLNAGIRPGNSLKGFGLSSTDLPGVFTARLVGNVGWADQFSPVGEHAPDSEIHKQMKIVEKNNFVPYNVAAPLISVPTPFDPAIVLDNLRTHIATWPSKQLADATFAAQLDAELIATANAYRANQPEVARDHIEIMLDMIRREHKDIDRDDDDEHDNKRAEKESDRKSTTQPIRLDRLAARVLDFDLKYVLKRMKKDDEHEHETKKH